MTYDRQKLVARICELRGKRATFEQIVQILDEEGYRSMSGQKVQHAVAYNLFVRYKDTPVEDIPQMQPAGSKPPKQQTHIWEPLPLKIVPVEVQEKRTQIIERAIELRNQNKKFREIAKIFDVEFPKENGAKWQPGSVNHAAKTKLRNRRRYEIHFVVA